MIKTYKQFISEKMCVDVKVGDTILRGRFKNKKTIVKKIGKDKHGPTINGKPALSFRLTKESTDAKFNIFDEHRKGYYIVLDFKENFWRIGYPTVTKDLKDFINNNIGQICKVVDRRIYIKYENIPNEIEQHFFENEFSINRNHIGEKIDIVDIAENKSELEYIFTSNKYNL